MTPGFGYRPPNEWKCRSGVHTAEPVLVTEPAALREWAERNMPLIDEHRAAAAADGDRT
jgi:hypothetical protein